MIAKIERILTDACNAIRDIDTRQRSATIECPIANARHNITLGGNSGDNNIRIRASTGADRASAVAVRGIFKPLGWVVCNRSVLCNFTVGAIDGVGAGGIIPICKFFNSNPLLNCSFKNNAREITAVFKDRIAYVCYAVWNNDICLSWEDTEEFLNNLNIRRAT